MAILITGSTGFLGRALLSKLASHGLQTRAVIRKNLHSKIENIDYCKIKIIDGETDWGGALLDINTIVHCAARAHVMNDSSSDPLLEFRKVNTFGTLNLAEQAADSGVKRFIFISSIKVNGEFTNPGNKFTPDDIYIPSDPYGLSKYEAEQGLKNIAKETEMDVVIIRPPLIYGPNVKANFRSMLKWVNRGVPLPFGAVNNKRSLVALSNLVDFTISCVEHPKAANETFLISDGEDVSTTNLLYKIGKAFNKKTRLIPIPVKFMEFGAKIVGKEDLADRIFGNLQVDSSKAEELLGWNSVVTMDQELKKTVDAYLNEKNI